MKVITWNVDNSLIGVNGRSLKLLSTIKEMDPDIICLQEVSKPMYDILIDSDISSSYTFTGYDVAYSYRTIMIIKKSIKIIDLLIIPFWKSSMDREYILLKTHGFNLYTFHLESAPMNFGTRKEQVLQMMNNTDGYRDPRSKIMCGDTNFVGEFEKIDDGYVDYSPNEPSYNYTENKRVLGPYISKLDRVYTKNLKIETSRLIKDDYISDHFGIVFTF
jgi:endonuclease/exonuclease/phosphatase family metal-dependent hydrolase